MVIIPVTDQNFDEQVIQSNKGVLVDFWAEWCGPCRALAPKLEEISNEVGGKVTICKMNIDENPESPAKYGVKGIPTMILFKGGKALGQLVGNQPKEGILDFIKEHV